jgi:hypothetical protein
MRVVKLNNRYVLGRYGFTHAFRFDRENKQSDAVKKVLYQIHGKDTHPWNIWWHWNNQDAPWGYYKAPKKVGQPYWIGVRHEADISAIMLMVNYE